MEEVTEDAYLKWLEAENVVEVFKGMSKEMSGKLQILQFNLSGSFNQEDNLKSELNDKESAFHKLDSSNARLRDFLMAQTKGLKESLEDAEDKLICSNTENATLTEKISSLEEQLNEYELETKDLERSNEKLKDKLAETEAKAEESESRCKILEAKKSLAMSWAIQSQGLHSRKVSIA